MSPEERKRNLQMALITLAILSIGLFVVLRLNEPVTSGNAVQLANPTTPGARSSVPMPLIAYAREVSTPGFSYDSGSLHVVKCVTDDCSSAGTPHSLFMGAAVSGISMVRPSNGKPIIFFMDAVSLKVAACNDSACATASIYTIDGSAGLYNGNPTSAAIGADGFPIVAYHDSINKDVKVAHCTNENCTSTQLFTVDSEGDTGLMPALIIGSNRRPFIAFKKDHGEYQSIQVSTCVDTACTRAVTHSIAGSHGSVVGDYIDMKRGSDGLPIVAYYGGGYGAGDLVVIHCNTPTCDPGTGIPNTSTIVDSEFDVGRYPRLVIGSDGLPMIFYQYVLGFVDNQQVGYDLKTARCLNIDCSQSVVQHHPNAELFGYELAAARNPSTGKFLVVGQNRHAQGSDQDLFALNCTDSSCAQVTPSIAVDSPSIPPVDSHRKAMSNAIVYV